MKPIDQMTNGEKARIIHALVPGDISGYLDSMQQIYSRLLNEKEQLSKDWDNDFISLDAWLEMAKTINTSIEKNGNAMKLKQSVFVSELFDSYGLFYSVHCLQQYSLTGLPSAKFKNLVAALFL
ncbi:hypothetical protein ACTJJ0_11080 [Chitinophaga sp. 22321]|uniref:hypothetical protein n=1 Tax=Chitinophaga sp. 22321 TaxID=3453909 RepID=UPI003F85C267